MRPPARGTLIGVGLHLVLWGGEALRSGLSWWGFGPLAGVVAVVCGVVVVRRRRAVRTVLRQPAGVLLASFVGWCSLSTIWSFYRPSTLIGLVALVATLLAALVLLVELDHRERMRTLLVALQTLVVSSLLFEVFVGAVIRHPITPGFDVYGYGDRDIPDAFYWSRAELFEGGRVQGLVGNANVLGFIALLALVLALVALREDRARRHRPLLLSLCALDVAALALTRSSTVAVAALAVAVAAAALLIARRVGRPGRIAVAAFLVVLVAAGAGAAVVARGALLGLLGRSPDLTGRLDIWESVGGLFAERPVLGWGWVSYWTPWAAPFDDLAIRRGVRYLQAHNAFLDVAFQTGTVGLALFSAVVATAAVAVVRRALAPGGAAATAILPALLLTALLAQSLAESRLILEGALVLLVVLALDLEDRRPRTSPKIGATPGSPKMRTHR